MEFRTGARAELVGYEGGEFTVHLSTGAPVVAEELLVAIGRRAQLGELGLESVGLDPTAGHIEIRDRMRASDRI